MTTNAFLSNISIQLCLSALTVSPQVYVQIPEANDLPNFGESTPLEDVTHFGSTSREYIGGLADGDEFTLACNRVHSSPNYQDSIIGLKGLTRAMRIVETDTSVSPNTTRTYDFNVVILGWSLAPGVGSKHTINFNFKITGGVTRS